jgi:hypothetical protein
LAEDSLRLLADAEGHFAARLSQRRRAAGGGCCCGRRTSGSCSVGPTPGPGPQLALGASQRGLLILRPAGRRHAAGGPSLYTHIHSVLLPTPRLGWGSVLQGLLLYHHPAEQSTLRPGPLGAGSRAVRVVGVCTTTRLSRAHRVRARWGMVGGRYVLLAGVSSRARPSQGRVSS